MITTFLSFAAMFVVFIVLTFISPRVWLYYIPASLIFQELWITILDRSSYVPQSPTVAMDPAAAKAFAFVLSILGSIIMGIAIIFTGEWIPFLICVACFVYALWLNEVF